MMKKFSKILMMAALIMNFAACKDDDNGGPTATEKLEELSMNTEWINYATAAASELLDDCIRLWAAWNGPNDISSEDLARIGSDFFTKNPSVGSNGYAALLKSAKDRNSAFEHEWDAIHTILVDGFENIATEVGEAKIGTPNGYAEDGDFERAVLEVESWYSWNSITDYSDNIISIMNGYKGRRGNIDDAPATASISSRVKSIDPDLDDEVTDAIRNAYTKITSMDSPFRNHLTGDKVTAAMDACTDLAELIGGSLLQTLDESGNDDDYTQILQVYADEVVVPTYLDLKTKAWALYNAIDELRKDPTSQSKLDAACNAWRTARVPWERSEAILFGPADKLRLDPSMDSWPLSQESIANILQNTNRKSVEQFIGAISSEDVRGFHTLELLLFKDGDNRTVRK